jgi:glutathione S-transferase
MPTHELVYSDQPGRAETIRICLHAANIDFTDTRFECKDWPSIKPTTPLGSVPVLKIDGVQHAQSLALARYAGKLSGFYPDDFVQALCVDEALDTLNELKALFKKSTGEFQDGTLTKYANLLESIIQNSGGVGFCSTPSIADLELQALVEEVRNGLWDHVDPKFFESYKGIVATVDAIAKNEKVVAYYASKE